MLKLLQDNLMIIGGIGVAVAVIQVCMQFHLNVVHNQGVH